MITPDESTNHEDENDELVTNLDEEKKDEKTKKQIQEKYGEDHTDPLLFINDYGPQYMPIIPIPFNDGNKTGDIRIENQATGGFNNSNNDFTTSTVSNGNLNFNQVNSILPKPGDLPITTQPTNNSNITILPTNFTNVTSTGDSIMSGDALTTNISNIAPNIGDCGKYTDETINSNEIIGNSMPKIGNDNFGNCFNGFGDCDCHCPDDCCGCSVDDCGCFVDCCQCFNDCAAIAECCCCCCDLFAASCDGAS